MNTAELLEQRQAEWKELETLTTEMRRKGGGKKEETEKVARFVSLYRCVCSDLALAESYHFPPGTIRYLNDLTGRAHHCLYRSQRQGMDRIWQLFFHDTPRWIITDPFFWTAMILFWIPFFTCGFMTMTNSSFGESVVGRARLEQMEEMYRESPSEQNPAQRLAMVGFYIKNNCGIALQCFSLGVLGGFGGLYILVSNAVTLGTIFGYMSGSGVSPEISSHFSEFVTAHGPFELTGIVLAGATGMKIGFAFIWTGGWRRFDSVRLASRKALPMMTTALVMIFLAALLEAFVSPSAMFPLNAKRLYAVISAIAIIYYLFVLGFFSMKKEQTQPVRDDFSSPDES